MTGATRCAVLMIVASAYRPVDEVVQWYGVEFTPAQYEEARKRRRHLKGGIR